MSATTVQYHSEIRPRRSLLEVDWQGIIHYRDLLWLLVRRDFVSKYKQTVLGPAWMVIQPLLTTLVFTVVFAKVAKIPTDSVPPVLFYMAGLLTWNLFAQILNGSGNVLQANAHLFGKVYFPRIIVPMANTISAFIPLLIQLVLFAVVYVVVTRFSGIETGSVHIGWGLLLFPVFAAQAAVISLGVALIFSCLTAVYRDLQHMLAFVVQTWMYLTPIIYPMSEFPEQWRWVVYLNPMTAPVEGARWALLGVGTISPLSIGISAVLAVVVFLIGFLWFNQLERSYVDRA